MLCHAAFPSQLSAASPARRAIRHVLAPCKFAPDTRSKEIVNKPLDQLIIDDHNVVRQLLEEYSQATDLPAKKQLAYRAIQELTIHSSKEEDSVYPVFGKIFGADVYRHLLDMHQGLKEELAKLSSMDTQDEKLFDAQVSAFKAWFDHHSKEEEEYEIPRLLAAPGVDALELGRQFQEAAAQAPTRPHPLAPNKPPLSSIAKSIVKPADEIADKIRFGNQSEHSE